MQGFFALIKWFFNHPWWDVLEEALHGETPLTPPIIITQVKPPIVMQTTNGTKLYNTAKGLLGQILAADNASDGYGMYGCAESVNAVAVRALGHAIGGAASVSAMYATMVNSGLYTPIASVEQALPGDICICVTGTSTLGANLHGHVGIVGVTWNMSNDSETATWEANYTRASWEASFAARGFTTHYFRLK